MPYVTSVERLARQEGIQEGIQKGREEGRLIGKIQTLEEILGREPASGESLERLGNEDLEAILGRLEAEYKRRFKG